jgi:ATP-binding cassette subfamily B protein
MTASGPRSKTLLHRVAGQTIALVGPTGAGKSTAIALLHRAFDPQSGIIRIDGMDVRGLKLTALRRNIGVVFQEALLFDRSIAENLRVGKPDAPRRSLSSRRDARRRWVIERSGARLR